MKVYIKATGKKQINERLESEEDVMGIEYNAFNPNGQYMTNHRLQDCQTGTVVAMWTSKDITGDNPVARYWATYNAEKNIVQ